MTTSFTRTTEHDMIIIPQSFKAGQTHLFGMGMGEERGKIWVLQYPENSDSQRVNEVTLGKPKCFCKILIKRCFIRIRKSYSNRKITI